LRSSTAIFLIFFSIAKGTNLYKMEGKSIK
jgi:hypothetical protein